MLYQCFQTLLIQIIYIHFHTFQLKTKCHDMEQKLKGRDNELNCLREQHKHLLHLSKDKHLGEREKLRQQVEELLETVNVQEEKIKVNFLDTVVILIILKSSKVKGTFLFYLIFFFISGHVQPSSGYHGTSHQRILLKTPWTQIVVPIATVSFYFFYFL